MIDTEAKQLREEIASSLRLEEDHPEVERCMIVCRGMNIRKLASRDDLKTIVRIGSSFLHWQRVQREKKYGPYIEATAHCPTIEPKPCPCGLPTGIVLPVDHPYWLTAFPPNSADCFCHHRQVTEYSIRKHSLVVTPEAKIPSTAHLSADYRCNFGIKFLSEWSEA